VKQLWQQAKNIETDSKAGLLQQFVDRVLSEDPNKKIMIFTEYTDTLEYARRGLSGSRCHPTSPQSERTDPSDSSEIWSF